MCIFAKRIIKLKEMKKTIFLLLVISFFLNAQCNNIKDKPENIEIDKYITHENRFEKLIDLATLYMETNPDFAFNCAYKANEIASQTKDTKQYIKSNILMGNIFEKYGFAINAIPYYKEAINNMILLNDYESIYKMYIKVANLHKDHDIDKTLSVKLMEKAVAYAYKCNDTTASIEAHMALADIHFQAKDYRSALTTYDKIIDQQMNDDNMSLITKAMTNKAKILTLQKHYDEAMTLIDSSLALCHKNSDHIGCMLNYASKAEVYDSLSNLDEAKKHYATAIRYGYFYEEYYDCGLYMYSLGMLEKKRNNIDLAIDIFKILCDSTEKFKMFDICYQSYYQLSKCYVEMDDYKEAYNLFNKYDVLYDSATIYREKQKTEQIYAGYNLSLNADEMKLKELEDMSIRKSKISKSILAAASIVISIMLISLITIYSRNKIIYYQNQKTVYEQQLKIDKMESELMEIQLKQNKELLMNMALHFKSYIEYITPIKKELKDMLESSDNINKDKIKSIYTSMQNNILLISNSENLNNQINEIYKDFLDRLEQKYPDITKAEKRLCAMLYINMSSKEIATITNTTLRSVETSRYRLRKKFNLTRDEYMVDFLRNI